MTQEEIQKVKEIIKIHEHTNTYNTQDVLENLQNGGDIDTVTFELFKLIVKRPSKFREANFDKSQPYVKRILEKGEKNTSMYNNLTFYYARPNIVNNILQLYNDDYNNTREIIHLIDDLQGRDKVPYLFAFFRSIYKRLYNRKFNEHDIEDLKILFSETNFDNFLNILKAEYGYLKKFAGETLGFLNMYDSIYKFIKVDKQFINDADIGLDIGGGFMTPDLSRLFEKNMICLDKNNPKENCNDINLLIKYPQHYITKIKNVEYIKFDSMVDSLPKEYNSYFITSFGFMASTVAVDQLYTDRHGHLENPFLTYMSCKRVSELIVDNKEVYLILWARPTTRVSENKIMSLKFKNGVLTDYDLLSDPDSTKYCNVRSFGCECKINFV